MPFNTVAAVDHDMDESMYLHHPEYFLSAFSIEARQQSLVLLCISCVPFLDSPCCLSSISAELVCKYLDI